MRRPTPRRTPDAREDVIARSVAQSLYDDAVALSGEELPGDCAFVRLYVRDLHHAPADQPHDLILVLAPREWSGAMVAQLRAFGVDVPFQDAHHAH